MRPLQGESCLLALAHVTGDYRSAYDAALTVADRRHVERDLDAAAVCADTRRLIVLNVTSPASLLQQTVDDRGVVGGNENHARQAPHFLRRVAKEFLSAGVPGFDASLQGEADDGVVGRFDDRREAVSFEVGVPFH